MFVDVSEGRSHFEIIEGNNVFASNTKTNGEDP
jgi:hypothetical protein